MKVSARPGSGASRLRHRLTPATSSVAATSSLPRNTCHRNPSLRHPVGASPFPYAGKKARIYTGGNTFPASDPVSAAQPSPSKADGARANETLWDKVRAVFR